MFLFDNLCFFRNFVKLATHFIQKFEVLLKLMKMKKHRRYIVNEPRKTDLISNKEFPS